MSWNGMFVPSVKVHIWSLTLCYASALVIEDIIIMRVLVAAAVLFVLTVIHRSFLYITV